MYIFKRANGVEQKFNGKYLKTKLTKCGDNKIKLVPGLTRKVNGKTGCESGQVSDVFDY